MGRSKPDMLQGTLEMLILKVLALEPNHGWGITHRIEQMSGEVLGVNQGSLYPALQRLQKRGLIVSEWRTTENNRRARYYLLTESGRKELAAEAEHWERLSGAVARIMHTVPGEV